MCRPLTYCTRHTAAVHSLCCGQVLLCPLSMQRDFKCFGGPAGCARSGGLPDARAAAADACVHPAARPAHVAHDLPAPGAAPLAAQQSVNYPVSNARELYYAPATPGACFEALRPDLLHILEHDHPNDASAVWPAFWLRFQSITSCPGHIPPELLLCAAQEIGTHGDEWHRLYAGYPSGPRKVNAVTLEEALAPYEMLCALLVPLYVPRVTEEVLYGRRGVTLQTSQEVLSNSFCLAVIVASHSWPPWLLK